MGTLCTWCLPQLGLVSDSWLKLLLIFYEAQQCALRIIMYFELNQSLDLSQFHTISMFLSLPGRKRWAKKFATGWYNHPGHLCFAVTAFVLWAMSCYGFLRPNLLTLEPKTSEQILTVQKRCAAFLWVHWKKHEKTKGTIPWVFWKLPHALQAAARRPVLGVSWPTPIRWGRVTEVNLTCGVVTKTGAPLPANESLI